MALAVGTHWDVRTTGDDTNGGSFNTAAAGTDYSQQDSPQVTYTDLVIGVTNTQLTSATTAFTSAHRGNTINITSGTGFTVGRYQVVSVASGVATMDRAVGTASSTGGNGKLGGAMATYGAAMAAIVNSNVVHLKSGTYTLTSTATTTAAGGFAVIGFTSSHYDGGKPTITTATNSIALTTISGSASAARYTFRNVILSNTAGTRAAALANGNVLAGFVCFSDCSLTGFSGLISSFNPTNDVILINTQITGFTGIVYSGGTIIDIRNCRIIDNAAAVFSTTAVNAICRVSRSILADNGGSAILMTGSNVRVCLFESTIANNTGDGVNLSSNTLTSGPTVEMENNIFYGNSGYGARLSSVSVSWSTVLNNGSIARNNAFGGHGTADRQSIAVDAGDVTLTADPFTDSSTGDYSLNNTAGGGAACKAAGVQPE